MHIAALRVGLLLLVVLTAAAWDWRSRRIPNALNFTAIIVGLLLWVAQGDLRGALIVFATTAAVIAVGMLFQAGGVLGGGDVKLLGAVAAMGGPAFFGQAMFWTLLVGVIVSLFILARGRALFPFAARLGRNVRAVLWRLEPEPAIDGKGHRMPYGMVIAAGCVAAMAAGRLGWTVLR